MVFVDFISLLLVALAGAVTTQIVAFAVALRTNRVDIVDIAWGLSAISIVIAMHLSGTSFAPAVILVDVLVFIWGARLSWHITKRIRRSKQQDPRYTKLMQNWPKKYRELRIFGKIFMIQALLALLVSLPVVVIHYYQPFIQPLIIVGLVIWLVGFYFEATADLQLKRFLKTSKPGELMKEGLWHYSRHPNYFGELTMWWGIAVMTLVTPLWWVGFLGAISISFLIYFVSGVPLAEERSVNKKGWQDYKNSTSVIIPWPPKKI
ncbi:DUF1295 domain-containing protein [Candidatus Saccharibacteria bacterium]|nr:DUF1295 domain-containing protein [Candidatus Saccharibacteria bacterium]NCU40688.1 DUF1295 domain-containing protein [Candidatus Saccharibacteria bacterium]